MADNVPTVWKFLRGKGLSPAQAAGVIGSMQGESGQGLDPAAENPGPDHALGIAQWLGGRKTAAVLTKQLGPQLNHLWGELQGPERGALQALKGAHTPEQAAIAWQRAFERGAPYEQKYNMRAANARKVFNRLSGTPGDPSAGGGTSSGGAGSRTRTTTTTTPGVDNRMARAALISSFLEDRNADPVNFAVQANALKDIAPTTSRETVRLPGAGGSGGTARAAAAPSGATGAVHFAAGADRPGVATQRIVKSFLAQLAGHAQTPINVGTGTNHNQMTTSGNVSDHWSGHAADLPQPVDSHQGDMVAAHALQAAGIPWSQAVRMAQKGGVFNVTPSSGPYKGHRVQVLWKTLVGGNHHNHVHIGIR